MAQKSVEKKLQNIEQSMADIEKMVCQIYCKQQDDSAENGDSK